MNQNYLQKHCNKQCSGLLQKVTQEKNNIYAVLYIDSQAVQGIRRKI